MHTFKNIDAAVPFNDGEARNRIAGSRLFGIVCPARQPTVTHISERQNIWVQVEFFTLEYASALAAGATTWPLAADYLAWCPQYGSHALKLLLENVSPTADHKAASAVLRLCRQYEMPEVAMGICRALGSAAAQVKFCHVPPFLPKGATSGELKACSFHRVRGSGEAAASR